MIETTYKVGIYIRLSREDEDKDNESESITNQRSFILDFLKENNYTLYDEYVDDGFSGTTFDRPAFKRMIADIEKGKINMVVTKDMSRLGRDYVNFGHYIEKYFPEHKFEAVFGQRPSVPRKPDPAGALEIAGLMDIPPESILYLGDSDTDMKTANAAGMYAVGALWGFRTAEELRENGAKLLISRMPSSALHWIKSKPTGSLPKLKRKRPMTSWQKRIRRTAPSPTSWVVS
jgi:beta-phosphoglucomutase-like phosphatase (HAD superfamily)